MPNPFPGMNPYLEEPTLWPNAHHLLISSANTILREQLRTRGYYVAIGERVWLTEPRRPIYPDLAVIRRPRHDPGQPASAAVLKADEPVFVEAFEVEVREAYLEIYDASGNRLVTGIEFVSPVNKAPGKGRRLYERKRDELLAAAANVVEIDLLRAGKHVLAVPYESVAALRPWHYLVSISRAARPGFEVYPVTLATRLPRVRIPLKAGDADGVLDLQEVVDRTYDDGPFSDRIDYSNPPVGRFSSEELIWIDSTLRSASLRS